MADSLISMSISPPDGGEDNDSAPEAVARNQGRYLMNLLTDRPGQVRIRGGITHIVEFQANLTQGKPIVPWVHNNALLIGKAGTAGGTREPWVAPYRRAAAAGTLAQANTTIEYVDTSAATSSDVAGARDTVPGHAWTRLGGSVWGVAYDNATSDLVNGGYRPRTSLLQWGGTAAVPTAYVNGPRGFQAIRAHLNRLFVGGGMKPGTTTYGDNSLYWSDDGGPTADTVAMWQDDVSGLTNEFVIDTSAGSDFIVALAKAGRALVVLKRYSVHVFLGDSPATFSTRPVSYELGCIDPRSVVEFEDAVYFMSERGYMGFDGSTLESMTPNLRSTIGAMANYYCGDNGQDGGFVSAGRLSDGYLGLTVGQRQFNTSADTGADARILNVAKRSTSRISSTALETLVPHTWARSGRAVVGVSQQRVWNLENLTSPERQITGSSRHVDVDSIGTVKTITAYFDSRVVQLADPVRRSQLQRLLVDYRADHAPADSISPISAEIHTWDNTGANTTLATFTAGSNAVPTASAGPTRRQLNGDAYHEAADVYVRLTLTSSQASYLEHGAIYNSWIIFKPSYQRRTR